jgi:sodium transport system permease protein
VNWQDIRILYSRELRAALRERSIVVNSILIPIFLYPFLLWGMFTGIRFVEGQTEGFVSRVRLHGLPAEHVELQKTLEDDEQIELQDEPVNPAEAVDAIRDDHLDALMELGSPESSSAALPDNFRARLSYDESKERSVRAKERLESALDRYRDGILEREASERGVGLPDWRQFQIERNNVASEREMGAFMLGLMLPLFIVIMVAVGSFFPAIDATAGERERSTWETSMSLATSRANVVVAKYFYVATMGSVAGMLNVTAIMLSVGVIFAPLLQDTSETLVFQMPLAALPVLILGAVLIALFVSAGMMIFASFARTFKEGQSMVGPFYLLIFMPVLLLQSPGLELTPTIALIPIGNLAMVFREALNGVFQWPLIALSVAVELVTIVICLWLAIFILRFEDFVIGSYSGNLGRFLKERFIKRSER